jgi:hypothetical protein
MAIDASLTDVACRSRRDPAQRGGSRSRGALEPCSCANDLARRLMDHFFCLLELPELPDVVLEVGWNDVVS